MQPACPTSSPGLSGQVANLADADKAVRLARDESALHAIRQRLEHGRLTCALFDTQRYVRHLEAAYMSMHERRLEGLPPASFAVARSDSP